MKWERPPGVGTWKLDWEKGRHSRPGDDQRSGHQHGRGGVHQFFLPPPSSFPVLRTFPLSPSVDLALSVLTVASFILALMFSRPGVGNLQFLSQ